MSNLPDPINHFCCLSKPYIYVIPENFIMTKVDTITTAAFRYSLNYQEDG
jgi:hypothetical protein